MKEKIRVLYIDDDRADRALVRDALEIEHGGFSVTEATTREMLETVLTENKFDAILSDLNIFGFDGLDVIDAVKKTDPDVPLIIVTGTESEETAIEAVENGAVNYVIKTPRHIRRLPFTIFGALEMKHLQDESKRAEAALRERDRQLREVYEAADNVAFITTDLNGEDTRILTFSPGAECLFGYSAEEIVGRKVALLHPPEIVKDFPAMQDALRVGRKGYAGETVLVRKSGARFPALFTLHPRYNESGELIGTLGVSIDITERKTAEETLQEEKNRAQQYLDLAGGIFVAIDRNGEITLINQKGCEILGYREEEILGKNWFEHFIPERLREEVIPVSKKLLAGEIGHAGYHENPVLTKSGEERMIAWNNTLLKDHEGNITGHLSSGTDITDLKDTMAELELKNLVFDVSVTANSTADTKGFINHVNNAFLEIWGFESREEVIGKPISYFLKHQDETSEIISVLDEKEKWQGEFTALRKDGSTFNAYSSATIVRDTAGKHIGYQSAVLDVSHQKHAEEELRNSEEKYRTLAENAHDGILIVATETGKHLFANQRIADITGYSIDELLETSIKDLALPSEFEKIMEMYNEKLEEQSISHQYETVLVRKDGAIVPIELTATKTVWNKQPADIVIIRDISERKRVEEIRIRLTTAIEHTAEVVVITDTAGTIQYVNPAFERTTGFTQEDAVGQNPRILKSGVHDEKFYRQMWDKLLRGEVWTGQITNKKKDGTLYTEEATISPIRKTAGKIVSYVAVKHDITERLQLEAQLLQAQKMEAVGMLAGGIAHDFNNILQAILGYTYFAKEGLSSDEKRFKDLEQVREGAETAASLTRQLLAFSRQQICQPRDLNLNELITGLLTMIKRIIGEHIHLDFLSAEQLGTIHIDQSQFEQVVMNLCVNARDAMPEGGKLIIKTENVLVDSDYCKDFAWAPEGRYILLSVIDSGLGMDENTQKRIFEPFFTTKEMGKGSGLGLSTVFGIVKQHQGTIHAVSEKGKGTTFKIFLPRVERPAVEMDIEKDEPVRGGSETILVAEDEAIVSNAVVRVLEEAGYRVLTALDGQQAVEQFHEHADEISMVLLDMVMPKLDGPKVYDLIRQIKPKVPALFTSGFSLDAIQRKIDIENGIELIQKPHKPHDLLQKVRKMLDATLAAANQNNDPTGTAGCT